MKDKLIVVAVLAVTGAVLTAAPAGADTTLSGSSMTVTGVAGDYGPAVAPGPEYTYVGRDLYMYNSSPQVSWFNTSASITPQTQTGYNFYENLSGELELNSIQEDGSNPETICKFDFLHSGAPSFSCIGGATFGLVTSGMFSLSDPYGLPNRRTWWIQDDQAGDLAFRMITDDMSQGFDWMDVVSNSNNRVDHIETIVPVIADASISIGGPGTPDANVVGPSHSIGVTSSSGSHLACYYDGSEMQCNGDSELAFNEPVVANNSLVANQSLQVGSGGSPLTNLGAGHCTLNGGTCSASTPGTTSNSFCVVTVQGATPMGDCSAQPSTGSTTVTCAASAPTTVAVLCWN